MIDALWLLLRAAGFVLLLQATGSVLFLAQVAGAVDTSGAGAIRALGLRTTLAALALVLAQGLYEPLHLAGAWDGWSDPSLRRLVFLSAGGVAFWLRVAGLAGVALALRRAPRGLRGLALPAALVALASFLVSGHTLLDAHRVILAPLLALHVLVAAFWFGSLAALRALLAMAPVVPIAPALAQFSRRAVWLVPLLALAGVCLAGVLLPDLAALRRPYGELLCLKALLFALLMGLAALNRLRLVPALERGEPHAPSSLRGTLAAEYFLIVGVLVATAALTGLFSPAEDSSA